ncbi:MAG: hypothetical protein GY841_12025 [FCB group bacterium]|nr:hypothetical protein [FCB group bacterium]
MSIQSRIFNIQTLSFLLLVIALLICSGCGDDSSPTGGNPPGSPTNISVPMDGALDDIQLLANQTTQVNVTLHVPPSVGVIASAELDVVGTLEHVNVTAASKLKGLLAMLSGQATAQAYIRVGSDPETVCQEGILYGPFQIAQGFFGDPSPEAISLDEPTVQLLNGGMVAICIDFISTFDANFSIEEMEFDVTSEDCGTPSDFAGYWSGPFECGHSCDDEPFGGTVGLTVTQDGSTASYVDLSDDSYTGTICGNKFRFERIELNEIERGTMTLIDNNYAIKRSTWRTRSEPYCFGDCVDTLTRTTSD